MKVEIKYLFTSDIGTVSSLEKNHFSQGKRVLLFKKNSIITIKNAYVVFCHDKNDTNCDYGNSMLIVTPA